MILKNSKRGFKIVTQNHKGKVKFTKWTNKNIVASK
jgi:hypothetical protein